MAKFTVKRKASRSPNFSRSSRSSKRASELKKFAYNLGQVNRGLKNSESAISHSYNQGATKKEYKKRSLFGDE